MKKEKLTKEGKLVLAGEQMIKILFNQGPTLEVDIDDNNGIKTSRNNGHWLPMKFKSDTDINLNNEKCIGFMTNTNTDAYYYRLHNPVIDGEYIKFDRCELV